MKKYNPFQGVLNVIGSVLDYTNPWCQIRKIQFARQLFNGEMDDPQTHYVFVSNNSVAALVHDTVRDVLILVEQFRIATVNPEGNKGGWMMEVVAGRGTNGIAAVDTLAREIEEEIGYIINPLDTRYISTTFVSPGANTEQIALFYVPVTPSQKVTAGGGVDEEGEETRIIEIPANEVDDMLRSGTVTDAKTYMALQWFLLHRAGISTAADVTPVSATQGGNVQITEYDAFLGGACGTTTWRKDIAIPMMEAAGLTFYNPQVDVWYDELAAIEEKAKRESRALLFVTDGDTRAIVTMLEQAFYLGMGRRVYLVVKNMPEGQNIPFKAKATKQMVDHIVDEGELADLNRGRRYIETFCGEKQVQIFSTIEDAVEALIIDVKREKAVELRRTTTEHRVVTKG